MVTAQEYESRLQDVHRRVQAACARCVEKRGVTPQEAFRRHMEFLRQTYPPVWRAYCLWLLENHG